MNEIAMNAYYVRNPDIVVREADEDGALLFNPDTNEVKAINATALFIWEQCDGRADLASIVSAIQEAFEGAPTDLVGAQVQVCIEALAASGFIGTLENQTP